MGEKVAVVGAGISGLAAAWQLVADPTGPAGLTVTVSVDCSRMLRSTGLRQNGSRGSTVMSRSEPSSTGGSGEP